MFPRDRFEAVLKPSSHESTQVDGWGDFRLKLGGDEVAFSFEDPGIQLTFEKGVIPELVAEKIVQEITSNVEREVDSPCYFVRIA